MLSGAVWLSLIISVKTEDVITPAQNKTQHNKANPKCKNIQSLEYIERSVIGANPHSQIRMNWQEIARDLKMENVMTSLCAGADSTTYKIRL